MRVFEVVLAAFWILYASNMPVSVLSLPEPARVVHHKRYTTQAPTDRYGRPFVDRDINLRDERTYHNSDDYSARVGNDVVKKFTRPVKGKIIVSSAAATTLAAIIYAMSSILFSSAPAALLWMAAISGGVGTYFGGDFGEFCRALGVFSILLMRRTSFSRFLVKFVSQSKAALRLAGRRPFPPGSNPWRYAPEPGAEDLQFGMMSALLSVLLSAAYTGWLLARCVPLLPNWLGALGGAVTVGYATTLPDGRGDLLRYIGHCLVCCFTVVAAAMDDVHLKEKLNTLMGHLLFFTKAVDDKYRVLSRLQLLLAAVISRMTTVISRIRRDMNGESRRETRWDTRFGGGDGYERGYDAGYEEDSDFAAAADKRDRARRYGPTGGARGGARVDNLEQY